MKEWLLALLWLISFAGHVWFWAGMRRLPAACAPLTAIGALTLAMYAGGMARILPIAAWGMLLCGLGLFGWMIFQRSRALLRWELLLFALGCLALWLRYRGALLTSYDDFSHWGMIVRHMLAHHRLPAAQDALITFQSYPPGAACWMYYACRFLGGTDGMMLSAQAAFTLAGWLCLFALIQGRAKALKALCAAACTLIGLSLFQGTASLMVDNLLPAVAMGAVCLLAGGNRCPWLSGLLASALVLIKDSGLYFAAVIAVLYAFLILREGGWKKSLLHTAKLCLPVLMARGAWAVHIHLAFPAADVSRHALTVENLRRTGADKSYADMFTILKKLLGEVFTLRNQAVQILLIMLFACIAVWMIRSLERRSWRMGSEWAVWLASVCAYAVWTGFLGLMYIFSMPVANALELVAFERYNSTCALFLYGVLLVWLFRAQLPKARYAPVILLLALVPLAVGPWTSGVSRLMKENYFVPLRQAMETLSRQSIPGRSAAVVVSPEDDTVYADYMARYAFQDASVEAVSDPKQHPAQTYYIACETDAPFPDGTQVIRLP